MTNPTAARQQLGLRSQTPGRTGAGRTLLPGRAWPGGLPGLQGGRTPPPPGLPPMTRTGKPGDWRAPLPASSSAGALPPQAPGDPAAGSAKLYKSLGRSSLTRRSAGPPHARSPGRRHREPAPRTPRSKCPAGRGTRRPLTPDCAWHAGTATPRCARCMTELAVSPQRASARDWAVDGGPRCMPVLIV